MSNKRRPVKNRDNGWVQQSFMLKPGSISDAEHTRRIFSNASWSYIDTTLGGNFSLNNLSQYTKFADIKTGGLTSETAAEAVGTLYTSSAAGDNRDAYISQKLDNVLPNIGSSKGIGRFWFEQHQENSVYVHMRFGVPKFTSLIQFFGSFYNTGASGMARKGLLSELAYTAGQLIGGIALLPFQPFILGGRALRFWTDMPNTKFYTLKPDMSNYWHSVNTIANAIAVNIGIIPTWSRMGSMQYEGGEKSSQRTIYADYMRQWRKDSTSGGVNAGLSKILGNWEGTFLGEQQNFSLEAGKGMWTDDGGGIDVRAIAMRGQGLAFKHLKLRETYVDSFGSGKVEDFRPKYTRVIQEIRGEGHKRSKTMEQYIKSYLKMSYYNLTRSNESDSRPTEADFNNSPYNNDPELHADATANAMMQDNNSAAGGSSGRTGNFGTDGASEGGESADPDSLVKGIKDWISTAKDYTKIALDEGAEFITFKVDNPGTMSESFSTSTRESDIASKINSTSTNMRNLRFNISGGIGQTINDVMDMVGQVAGGIASEFGIQGLATLMGSGFVDIPEMVDQTTAQLPSTSYTIQLRSPYGNPLSMMQKLYIPLACILAGALPRSTGPASYTAPFICQLFSKGRQLTRLGVIKSLTISRGQGNIGWTADGRPLGIDVTFEVADLSKVLHMPLAAKLSTWDKLVGTLGELTGHPGIANAFSISMYNEDSSYTDYLAVLGSLGIHETLLSNNARWAIKVANRQANLSSQTAASAFALWATEDTLIGSTWKALTGFSALDR